MASGTPTSDYTVVPNSVLRGESRTSSKPISIEARWLLGYALSRPKGWVFRASHLADVAGVSERTIGRMIAELVAAGLCSRDLARKEDGTLSGFATQFHPITLTTGQKATDGEMAGGSNQRPKNHSRSEPQTVRTTDGEMADIVSTEDSVSTEGVASTEGSASTEGDKREGDEPLSDLDRIMQAASRFNPSEALRKRKQQQQGATA